MLIFALLLQITPVQPMPKGTALPPPGTDEAQVMAPIQSLLSAIEANDAAAVAARHPVRRAARPSRWRHQNAAAFIGSAGPNSPLA